MALYFWCDYSLIGEVKFPPRQISPPPPPINLPQMGYIQTCLPIHHTTIPCGLTSYSSTTYCG
jgi:hypothetical protein